MHIGGSQDKVRPVSNYTRTVGGENPILAQYKPLHTLGNLESSISGISVNTSPSTNQAQQIYQQHVPQNPLKARIGGPLQTESQTNSGGNSVISKSAGLPPNPGRWATEGSEAPNSNRPPIPTRSRTELPEHSTQELTYLRSRVQQLESENRDLQIRLQQSQSLQTQSSQPQSRAIDEQIRRLYKSLKDMNPSWSPLGLEILEERSATGLDPQRLTVIFDKAIQAVQNEGSLINRVNDIHRKYGLSHYCISRLRDLNRQLKQGLERIHSESVKVPVQTSSGNWVYVHKDSDQVVARMEEYLKAWLKKVANLEESPEFVDLRTDLQ